MFEAASADLDLHAFVDGCLDNQRRVDVLKRVARSPADRAKIALWQDQNDSLRAAFVGIEDEVLPQTLDLRSAKAKNPFPPEDDSRIFSSVTSGGRQRGGLALSGITAAAILIVGFSLTTAVTRDTGPRAVQDTGLADPLLDVGAERQQAPSAIRGASSVVLKDSTSRKVAEAVSRRSMPIRLIPDLGSQDLSFDFATHEPSGALSLHYVSDDGQRVVVTARAAPHRELDRNSANVRMEDQKGLEITVDGTLPRGTLERIAEHVRDQIEFENAGSQFVKLR